MKKNELDTLKNLSQIISDAPTSEIEEIYGELFRATDIARERLKLHYAIKNNFSSSSGGK